MQMTCDSCGFDYDDPTPTDKDACDSCGVIGRGLCRKCYDFPEFCACKTVADTGEADDE